MKILSLLFVASVSFSLVHSQAQAGFCEDHAPRFCLAALLSTKCAGYSSYGILEAREIQCEAAARKLAQFVSPRKTGPTYFVIFEKELVALAKEPRVLSYVIRLRESYRQKVTGETRFSLWEETLAAAEGHRAKALEWIAVLLQDTTEQRTFVEDAVGLSPTFRAQLHFTLSALSPDPWARFYPPLDASEFNPAVYHFYRTAYLASRLQSSGVGAETAAFVSFLLTAVYELSEMEPGQKTRVWEDPAPFDPKRRDWKLRDLYAAYMGARFGVGEEKGSPSFAEFSRTLSGAPRDTMNQLYFDFFGRSFFSHN